MRKTRNRLDEMQEQKLLRIECRGCWFAFWALLASIFIQQFLFGIGDFKQIAGEWIVFMVLALYLCIACMRAGIWSRSLKPTFKTNLVASFVAAVAAGAIVAAINYKNYGAIEGAAVTFVVFAIMVFFLCLIALTFSLAAYKRRIKKMEEDYTEDDK